MYHWSRLLRCCINQRACLAFIRRREMSKVITADTKFDLYRLESGPAEKATINEEEANYALKTMIYMRRIESKAAELYKSRLINGFLHLYSGQEAVAVGLKMDHFYGGDGIVGGQVPVGTGLGLAQKYNGTGGVSWTLYGDGAASQGQIFESYNLLLLWNLPVVYICENNHYGMGTVTHRHSANTKFYTRGDLIPGIRVNGMKVMDVREAIKFAREHALRHGPIILKMDTYRYFGHSMSDPGVSYRSREEVKSVRDERDPIKLFGDLLIKNGLKTAADIQQIQSSVNKAVDAELEQAKADPPPEMSDIRKDVYVKPLEEIRLGGKVPWEVN